MNCRVCNSESKKLFEAKVLNKYVISYYHCSNCSFLQTEKPYWLDEAYNDPINYSDTGLVKRNLLLSQVTSSVLFYFFDKNGSYLDYAGGYGLFVRLMRDIGFDFYWHDIYTPNLMARGFEYKEGNKVDLVSVFETFEHFVNPMDEIEKILKISRNILFSTALLADAIPQPDAWWYYGLEHGQHIAFYNAKTFQFIAKKYGLNFYTNGKIHLLTEKKINAAAYKLHTKILFVILSKIVALRMKSKRWSDHLKMEKRRQEA